MICGLPKWSGQIFGMLAEEHQRFNLALVPASAKLRHTCLELAQSNLADRADGYLLGENANPHVTVCQFRAPVDQLSVIWSAVQEWETSLFLLFSHLFILPGQSEHLGKIWVGFAIAPAPKLVELQQKAYRLLTSFGLTTYNPPEKYFPHMTWARCSSSVPFAITAWPPSEIWQQSHEYHLTLGSSDDNGVYQEQLFRAHSE